MQPARQIAGSLFIAILALAVVLGGLSLSIVESGTQISRASNTSKPIVSGTTTIIPTKTQTLQPGQTASPKTPTLSPTSTLSASTCLPPAGWVSLTINPGQTLESLALTYNTSVESLVQANCLVSADVPAGSIVYIPRQATQPFTTQIATLKCGPPFGWIFYYVQSGDTLYAIATRYRSTVTQLITANCLASATIVAGQPLYVPNIATIMPLPTLAGLPSSTPEATVEASNTPTNTLEPTLTNTPVPTNTEVPTSTPNDTDTPSG
jgi:LysM repeat protein